MTIIVQDRQTGEVLTASQIMHEVNRDRSAEWTDYTLADLVETPHEVLDWIGTDYYNITIGETL